MLHDPWEISLVPESNISSYELRMREIDLLIFGSGDRIDRPSCHVSYEPTDHIDAEGGHESRLQVTLFTLTVCRARSPRCGIGILGGYITQVLRGIHPPMENEEKTCPVTVKCSL